MMTWQNWSGSVTCTPAAIQYPSTLDEIVALVKQCAASGKKLRVVGAGHSFTPLVATDQILVSLDHYAGLEHIENHTATVKAGTRLKALGDLLFQHGLAQENLGDINVQSIAGAISTGTHGTGVNFGSISTQVIGLKLVTGDGSVVECSETQNRDLFKAAQVSLGALGVIVSVTLRLQPMYTLHIDIRKKSLSECLANLETYKHDNRHFEINWIPYTDTVQAKFTNLTTEPAQPKSFASAFNEYALENGALWLFSVFNRQFPSMSERVCKTMAAFVSDATTISHAHQVFASVRKVKFQEMEYNLPADCFPAAIREVDEAIRREKIKVHIPVECRFAKGDDINLSPAYGRDSAYIAVHMFKGMEYRRYFEVVEAIFKKYEGRPHWGKMHTRTAHELRALYPRWDDFQKVRDMCDPQRVFTTSYIASILGD